MNKKVSVVILSVFCLCMLVLAGCAKDSQALYTAEIDEVFVCNTYNGKALVVNLNVTNTSKEYLDAYTIEFDMTAKLDGTMLDWGYLSSDSDNYINPDQKIAAGETAKVQVVYKLGTQTDGEITLLGVTDDINYQKQIEFLNETLALSEIEEKVTKSNYALTIDNVVKTDDGDGNDLIIIDMTFTNNSEKTTSYKSAIDIEIFQNGIALKSAYLPYNHPSKDEDLDGNHYLDIQSDVSIPVREIYTLNDSSAPIEVKATDSMSYDTEALFNKEIQIQ